jgi:mRNA interferase HicA
MAPRLLSLRPKEVIKALEHAGFVFERQRGSHVTLGHPGTRHTTVIPVHAGDISRSLPKLILKQARISKDEFRQLL